MKKFYLLITFAHLLITMVSGQKKPTNCKELVVYLHNNLIDRIEAIKHAPHITNDHLQWVGEWMLELKEHVNKNSFGLFTGSAPRGQKCNSDIVDIFRNFFGSNYQYIFQPDKYPNPGDCGNFAAEPDMLPSMGRLRQISFALRTAFNFSNQGTLKESEKILYSAFFEFLHDNKDPEDSRIQEFFFLHLDDIRKATGVEFDPGDQDRNKYVLEFIRSFEPFLKFYFGRAEEEYINAGAKNELSKIRNTMSHREDWYRRDLITKWVIGLETLGLEFRKLSEICDKMSVDPLTGMTTTITTYNPTLETAKTPKKPTGEAGNLKPGYGWVLLGILTANGKIYREYGDLPLVGLYIKENGKNKHFTTIRSGEYHQVAAGTYFARISMAAYPQSGITVENGGETKLALRLGRLVLDPRNFDGTPGQQPIVVWGVVDQNETTEGAIITDKAVNNNTKGGDSLDVPPGRYEVRVGYGIKHISFVTIESQQTTKITVSGVAKFTGPKEVIKISRIVPNVTKPEYVANLDNGRDIQLPPGTYEIERPDILYKYRITMERGGSYTYKRP